MKTSNSNWLEFDVVVEYTEVSSIELTPVIINIIDDKLETMCDLSCIYEYESWQMLTTTLCSVYALSNHFYIIYGKTYICRVTTKILM